jgi:hypothetical protein
MYSFAQRDDVRVVDEPLYGHYLRVSGADHPGRDDIIANMNCDGAAVMRELLARQERDSSVRLFQKHMAHHLVDLDLGFLRETSNIFLIRNPREMLPSLTIQLPHASLSDTGLKRQWEIYDELRAAGQTAVILDSRELLLDPAGILEKGALAEDGIWAPHWYHAVHQSTGFAPYQPKGPFPDDLLELLANCKPWYDRLFENALTGSKQGEN